MGTLNDLKMPSLNDKIVEKDTLAKAEVEKIKKDKAKKEKARKEKVALGKAKGKLEKEKK